MGWTQERFARARFETPRLDGELLLAHALGQSRLYLYLHHDEPVAEPKLSRFRELVQRRLEGEPVAYLVGRREFWSLDLKSDARALVPRPETEALVEEALERLKGREKPTVVDVGTGCGAVALAIAKERPDALVWAMDISADALELARENATALQLSVNFVRSDLLTSLPAQATPADMVLANLPYLKPDEVRPALRFEPRIALTAEDDGLTLTRTLLTQAADVLLPGGWVAVEVGAGHADEVAALFEQTGHYTQLQMRKDMSAIERVVAGQRV